MAIEKESYSATSLMISWWRCESCWKLRKAEVTILGGSLATACSCSSGGTRIARMPPCVSSAKIWRTCGARGVQQPSRSGAELGRGVAWDEAWRGTGALGSTAEDLLLEEIGDEVLYLYGHAARNLGDIDDEVEWHLVTRQLVPVALPKQLEEVRAPRDLIERVEHNLARLVDVRAREARTREADNLLDLGDARREHRRARDDAQQQRRLRRRAARGGARDGIGNLHGTCAMCGQRRERRSVRARHTRGRLGTARLALGWRVWVVVGPAA